ncbi:MAG: 50S ribosomal protein L25/general stress protein Ctc [Pseudomonadota bacterium]
MASTLELDATTRSGVGKGAARQARRDGQVPGVVYGGNQDPVAINIHQPVLLKMLKAGKFLSTLIKMKIDGAEQTVICRSVQRDLVKDLPIHADFLRLSERSRISLMIPVDFQNEDDCPGLKKGGVLTVVRNEVELRVRANNIPEALVVDLTGLEINDVVRISDVIMPEGAAATITDRDFMIANISAPSALSSAEDEEEDVTEGADAAGAEGEGEDAPEEATEE